MHRFVAALLAAASCAGIAQAQTSPPPAGAQDVLTLDEALAEAGLSSPSNEAAAAGVRASESART
ncbi:hypothetical protein, partial [Raoultella ornithinolytica]